MCSGSTPTGIPIPRAKVATSVSPGLLDQHPPRELEVQRQAGEQGPTSTGAQRFLVGLHAAEGSARATARFPGLESCFANEALGLHLDVETELVVHSTFGVLTTEQEAQAGTGFGVFRRICGQNGGLVVPRQTHSVRGCLPAPAAWG